MKTVAQKGVKPTIIFCRKHLPSAIIFSSMGNVSCFILRNPHRNYLIHYNYLRNPLNKPSSEMIGWRKRFSTFKINTKAWS
jgi:hypothetical protein